MLCYAVGVFAYLRRIEVESDCEFVNGDQKWTACTDHCAISARIDGDYAP